MSSLDGRGLVVAGDADTLVRALRSHPMVRAATATVVPGEPPALVAHVVPADDPEISAGPADGSVVDEWRTVFDDCYEPVAEDPGSGTTVGWVDSLTGAPVPAGDMAEWVDTTMSRVAGLAPGHVLEIGAGTGLLMRPVIERLAPEDYVATDFSAESVRILTSLAGELRAAGSTTSIAVHERPATAPPAGGYDLVLLNSVVQYFPSTMYLEAVLRTVLPSVRSGGHVFLGDLRNGLLRTRFATLKQRRRSPAGTADDEVARQVARELALDGELSLVPEYPYALATRLPGITAVEVAPRRGGSTSEMTLFRYDAVLHVGCAPPPAEPDWADGSGLTLTVVDHRLAHGEPFGFRGVGNARLAGAHRSSGRTAIDPETLCRLAERHGWTARLGWTPGAADGEFDVWCSPPGAAGDHYRFGIPRRRYRDPVVQPAFPPRVEQVRRAELLAFLAAEPPSRPVPRDVRFVTDLPENVDTPAACH